MICKVAALHLQVTLGASHLQTSTAVNLQRIHCRVFVCVCVCVVFLSMLLQLLSGNRVLAVGTDTQEMAAVHFMQGEVGLCNFSVAAREREGSVFTVWSINGNSSQTGCVYILIQILLLVSR